MNKFFQIKINIKNKLLNHIVKYNLKMVKLKNKNQKKFKKKTIKINNRKALINKLEKSNREREHKLSRQSSKKNSKFNKINLK